MFGVRVGKLGSVGNTTLVQRAIAILRRPGITANVYLPGIGALSGLQAANYLDSVGTTAATVDQPVGLVLDGMGSVGVELFNFANVSVASGVVVASINGGYSFNGSAAAAGDDGQRSSVNFTTAANNTYLVQLTINNDALTTTGSGFFARQGANGTGTIVFSSGQCSAKTYSFFVQASGTTTSLLFDSALDKSTYAISNISIKEVTGTHATQATTANKGVLKLTGGRYNWVFDATDLLTATYPAGYESVTVIDSKSTGQVTTAGANIVGAYSMGPSVTLYGRMVVKGTLTTPELTTLQSLANNWAGL